MLNPFISTDEDLGVKTNGPMSVLMGKLAFYLEALDRDYRRPHENPSIGVLLCRTKDDEVIEYAMNRHLSPALVTQYEMQMLPKELLQRKLHEWGLLSSRTQSKAEAEGPASPDRRSLYGKPPRPTHPC